MQSKKKEKKLFRYPARDGAGAICGEKTLRSYVIYKGGKALPWERTSRQTQWLGMMPPTVARAQLSIATGLCMWKCSTTYVLSLSKLLFFIFLVVKRHLKQSTWWTATIFRRLSQGRPRRVGERLRLTAAFLQAAEHCAHCYRRAAAQQRANNNKTHWSRGTQTTPQTSRRTPDCKKTTQSGLQSHFCRRWFVIKSRARRP